jgi:hypothetical protein
MIWMVDGGRWSAVYRLWSLYDGWIVRDERIVVNGKISPVSPEAGGVKIYFPFTIIVNNF